MLIALRPLQLSDAEVSVAWRADPEIWTYTLAAGRDAPGIEAERRWIEQIIADPTSIRRAILVDGVYVGNTYLTGLDRGEAEYHIFIGDRSMWGRGIAGQVTAMMLDLAWNECNLERVHLIVHSDNRAAIRIYRSLGFADAGMDGRFIRMVLARPSHNGSVSKS